MIKLSDVKFDCRFFRGHIPCMPNKNYGVICSNCDYYKKTDKKILIIKLGAAGDVIRTTPLLYPLKKNYPDSKIYWLTYFPDIVPVRNLVSVDEVLDFSVKNVSFLESMEFDMLINLDKDNEAISLASRIKSAEKFGFIMKNGVCYPANKLSEHKFLTGIFDNISIQNKKNYLQEIFEICGYKFNGEKYLLDTDENFDRDFDLDKSKTVIGLNTGCGERWTSRLWKDENWIDLVKLLKDTGYEVLLLGGPAEDEKNKKLSAVSGAKYFGVFELKTFINLVKKCDVIITQVTMTMHIAIALGKKLVLMNNIFNPYEFELYDSGVIVQPDKDCKCYFRPVCVNEEYKCMDHLTPEKVFDSFKRLVS